MYNKRLIAYHDRDDPNSTHGTLKAARRAATGEIGNCGPVIFLFYSWVCETVDTGQRQGGPHNVGSHLALTVNSTGLATIAYYDATAQDLWVALQLTPLFLPAVRR